MDPGINRIGDVTIQRLNTRTESSSKNEMMSSESENELSDDDNSIKTSDYDVIQNLDNQKRKNESIDDQFNQTKKKKSEIVIKSIEIVTPKRDYPIVSEPQSSTSNYLPQDIIDDSQNIPSNLSNDDSEYDSEIESDIELPELPENELESEDKMEGVPIIEAEKTDFIEKLANELGEPSKPIDDKIDTSEYDYDITEKLKEMGEISLETVKKGDKPRKSESELSNPESEISVTPAVKKEEKEGETSEDKTNLANIKGANLRKNIREVMDENKLDEATLAAQRQEMERLRRVQEQQRIIREVQRQIALNRQNTKTQHRVISLLQGNSTIKQIPGTSGTNRLGNTVLVKLPNGETKPMTRISKGQTPFEVVRLQVKGKLPRNLIPIKKPPTSNLTPSVSIAPVSKKIEPKIESESEDEDSETEPSYNKPSPKPKEVVTISSSSDDDCIVLSEDEPEEPEPEEDPCNSGMHTNDTYNIPDEQGRVLINVGHPENEADIFLAPQIARVIKPHQIGGVRFLYDNVIESIDRFNTSTGFGCILAHSMGLGKTLQVVCFSDIFLRHTSAKTILCILPINTLQNWMAEYNMWLPKDPANSPLLNSGEVRPRNFNLHVLNDSHKNLTARSKVISEWHKDGGILLIGYELFRLLSMKRNPKSRNRRRKTEANEQKIEEDDEKNKNLLDEIHEALIKPGPDLVICDEGHRIKNSHASISHALKQIRTKRRVVLTGYPLQNNLLEYWCMVDFVRPNYLGTKTEFSNMFERPIQNGQCIDSTPQDIRLMRYRAHVLHSLLEGFVQRRSHAVLQTSLPQKEEYVLLVRMTEFQRKLYDTFMNEVVRTKTVPNPLKAFAVCCKIWNHPDVLYYFLKKRNVEEVVDIDLDEVAGSTTTENKTTTPKKGRARGGGARKEKKTANSRNSSITSSPNSSKPAASITPNTNTNSSCSSDFSNNSFPSIPNIPGAPAPNNQITGYDMNQNPQNYNQNPNFNQNSNNIAPNYNQNPTNYVPPPNFNQNDLNVNQNSNIAPNYNQNPTIGNQNTTLPAPIMSTGTSYGSNPPNPQNPTEFNSNYQNMPPPIGQNYPGTTPDQPNVTNMPPPNYNQNYNQSVPPNTNPPNYNSGYSDPNAQAQNYPNNQISNIPPPNMSSTVTGYQNPPNYGQNMPPPNNYGQNNVPPTSYGQNNPNLPAPIMSTSTSGYQNPQNSAPNLPPQDFNNQNFIAQNPPANFPPQNMDVGSGYPNAPPPPNSNMPPPNAEPNSSYNQNVGQQNQNYPNAPNMMQNQSGGSNMVQNPPGGPNLIQNPPGGSNMMPNQPGGPSMMQTLPGGSNTIQNQSGGPNIVQNQLGGSNVHNTVQNPPGGQNAPNMIQNQATTSNMFQTQQSAPNMVQSQSNAPIMNQSQSGGPNMIQNTAGGPNFMPNPPGGLNMIQNQPGGPNNQLGGSSNQTGPNMNQNPLGGSNNQPGGSNMMQNPLGTSNLNQNAVGGSNPLGGSNNQPGGPNVMQNQSGGPNMFPSTSASSNIYQSQQSVPNMNQNQSGPPNPPPMIQNQQGGPNIYQTQPNVYQNQFGSNLNQTAPNAIQNPGNQPDIYQNQSAGPPNVAQPHFDPNLNQNSGTMYQNQQGAPNIIQNQQGAPNIIQNQQGAPPNMIQNQQVPNMIQPLSESTQGSNNQHNIYPIQQGGSTSGPPGPTSVQAPPNQPPNQAGAPNIYQNQAPVSTGPPQTQTSNESNVPPNNNYPPNSSNPNPNTNYDNQYYQNYPNQNNDYYNNQNYYYPNNQESNNSNPVYPNQNDPNFQYNNQNENQQSNYWNNQYPNNDYPNYNQNNYNYNYNQNYPNYQNYSEVKPEFKTEIPSNEYNYSSVKTEDKKGDILDLDKNEIKINDPTSMKNEVKDEDDVKDVDLKGTEIVPLSKSKEDAGIPYDWATELLKGYVPGIIENSAKMEIFFCIMQESMALGDRILLFSQSLFTLNLIEEFLQVRDVPESNVKWAKNKNYYRLDGSTTALEREKLINEFNSNPNIHLFLVSTRAGSLGINLVGANRVIVFDASWNPCHDTQAVCRVYRYGQKKPCFVYRLVTDNCLEKKIYDRQINKQGMSDRVIDECNPDAHLTMKDVTNLCWDDEEETEIKDFGEIKDKYIDVVMQKVLDAYSTRLRKEPFQHESLLIDRKEKKLSQAEKRLAKRSYELEKQANINSRPTYSYYSGIGQNMNIRQGMLNKPIASVRPMQSEMNTQISSPGRIGPSGRTSRWIPAEVWQRQGMTAQEMTLPLDVVIPTNSPERGSIVLKAGQKVLVLKSPKGIYMQLECGKIVAIKTAFKVRGGKAPDGKEENSNAAKDGPLTPTTQPTILKKVSGVNPVKPGAMPLPLKNNSAITVIPKPGQQKIVKQIGPVKLNMRSIRQPVPNLITRQVKMPIRMGGPRFTGKIQSVHRKVQLAKAKPYNLEKIDEMPKPNMLNQIKSDDSQAVPSSDEEHHEQRSDQSFENRDDVNSDLISEESNESRINERSMSVEDKSDEMETQSYTDTSLQINRNMDPKIYPGPKINRPGDIKVDNFKPNFLNSSGGKIVEPIAPDLSDLFPKKDESKLPKTIKEPIKPTLKNYRHNFGNKKVGTVRKNISGSALSQLEQTTSSIGENKEAFQQSLDNITNSYGLNENKDEAQVIELDDNDDVQIIEKSTTKPKGKNTKTIETPSENSQDYSYNYYGYNPPYSQSKTTAGPSSANDQSSTQTSSETQEQSAPPYGAPPGPYPPYGQPYDPYAQGQYPPNYPGLPYPSQGYPPYQPYDQQGYSYSAFHRPDQYPPDPYGQSGFRPYPPQYPYPNPGQYPPPPPPTGYDYQYNATYPPPPFMAPPYPSSLPNNNPVP